jgi:hypothetical protein
VADCNACSPPIPDTLYVTFCGLGGDFASALVRDPVSTATAVSRLLTVCAGLLAVAGMLFERQDLTG